jgi:STE24 endopeptidase
VATPLTRRRLLVSGVLALLCSMGGATFAQAPAPPIPAAATGDHIDPAAATAAYLATLPANKKARSDAYFEGGYWLELWSFLIEAAIFLGLLHFGVSARLRSVATRMTKWRFAQTLLYGLAFVLLMFLLSLPWSVYTDFFREHQYGLSNQTFGGWLGDNLKSLAVVLVVFPLALTALYAVLRRSGGTWWIWGSLVALAFLVLTVAIAPVYIAPLFNTYTTLKPSPVRDGILRLAHANGISAQEVYQVDASRQTTRVSANVRGLLGTERITLNDNLLNRASPAAIQAVLGHEMGHYVLNHGYKSLLALGLVIVCGFAIVAWLFDRLAARHVDRWGVVGVADPAGLPLIALLFTSYIFVMTPVINTIVRTSEFEADMFGLNAARQPDGFAEAALLLSDYRKMDPGPLEEMVFYDHPSGRTRIFTAMQWKAFAKP